MATLEGLEGTLADIAKRIGAEQPELIDAVTARKHGTAFRALPMRAIKGTKVSFNRWTTRPTVSWRNIGETVAFGKVDVEPWQESIFLVSGYSKVDVIVAGMDPRGPRAYRAEQDAAYLESLGYQASYGFFYSSNDADNSKPDGLMKRLPNAGTCVVNAGATNETISIYALRLGPTEFHGIYNPDATEGKAIGWRDYGAVIDESSSKGNEYFKTFFNMTLGFAQKHPLSIGRIRTINSSNLPTANDFFSLFSKMDGKPDLMFTTWVGLGYVAQLASTALHMTPNDRMYDVTISNVMGIPLSVDTALVDDESAISL